jgi:hypothetical protein
VTETVAAKASEIEVGVRRQQNQRECLRGRYVVGSQWNQREVVTAVKKAAAVVGVVAAEGIWAMVLGMAKVAIASADNSGNGGAGNGGRNRGSSGATTINQNAAAGGGGCTGVGGGGGSGNSSGSGSGGCDGYNGRGRL